MRKSICAIIVILSVVSIVSAAAILSHPNIIPSWGKLKKVDVEVYWNIGCTEVVDFVNWGTIEPGETVNVTVYIKSLCNVNSTLDIYTENWNPVTPYINFTAVPNNYMIQPGEVVETMFSCITHSSVSNITNFSFDIVVQAGG